MLPACALMPACEGRLGPLVAMNGDAAGWAGRYPPAVWGGGSDRHHGREGAGVSIMLDVVPTKGEGNAGEAQGRLPISIRSRRGSMKYPAVGTREMCPLTEPETRNRGAKRRAFV
jgi:hypothetical protein